MAPGSISEFTKLVENTIASIPKGRICTYGGIATASGNPRASRQVARILHARSKAASLPWHRVVGMAGKGKAKISLQGDGFAEQALLLRAEGVNVRTDGIIDLDKYGWKA
jgi:methylated-DNA-protein-cysteine methyltransferase related protein